MMISKMELICFQINLILELLEIIFKNYALEFYFFQISNPIFLAFVFSYLQFLGICTIFPFFAKKNCQVKKI